MRLARVAYNNAVATVFVTEAGTAYPLPDLAGSIDELVTLGQAELKELERRTLSQIAGGDLTPIAPDRWLPPVARPGKIIGVAMNNSAFAKPSYRYFSSPAYFMKSPSSLIGHGEPVIVREEYGLTHPEPELACIIGRHASHLDAATAREAIFGYTIINDITSVGLKDQDSLHLEFTSANPGQDACALAPREGRAGLGRLPDLPFPFQMHRHLRSDRAMGHDGGLGPESRRAWRSRLAR